MSPESKNLRGSIDHLKTRRLRPCVPLPASFEIGETLDLAGEKKRIAEILKNALENLRSGFGIAGFILESPAASDLLVHPVVNSQHNPDAYFALGSRYRSFDLGREAKVVRNEPFSTLDIHWIPNYPPAIYHLYRFQTQPSWNTSMMLENMGNTRKVAILIPEHRIGYSDYSVSSGVDTFFASDLSTLRGVRRGLEKVALLDESAPQPYLFL